MTNVVDDFVAQVNKTYGIQVLDRANKVTSMDLRRFSSGALPLDLALGGGWPYGRICIIAGQESSGKTLLCLKASESIRGYCKSCRKHKEFCDCKEFQPSCVLYVDIEGALDLEWAKKLGFDAENFVYARPDYGEQSIDLIDKAIRENLFDLIIVDSIAAISPSDELEQSAEDQQMGTAARLINKGFRKWTLAINSVKQASGGTGPCVLCINQFRTNIGVMYGDKRVLPGGANQRFATSITIFLKSMKYENDESKELAWGEISGVAQKNKTAIPRQEFTCTIALKDMEDCLTGVIDNVKPTVKLAKQLGIVEQSGANLRYMDIETKTEKEFIKQVRTNETTFRKLYRDVVFKLTSQLV